MSTFNSDDHPRGHFTNPGRFRDKPHSTPEATLSGGKRTPVDLVDLPISPAAAEAAVAIAAGGHNALVLTDHGSDRTADALIEQIAMASGKRAIRAESTTTPSDLIGPKEHKGLLEEADGGILVMADAANWSPRSLDVLRQPMESGALTVAQGDSIRHIAADIQVIMTSDRCPCGQSGDSDDGCICTPVARRRFRGRIAGPILDRMDARVEVPSGVTPGKAAITTANAKSRVEMARQNAAARVAKMRLPDNVTVALDRALERGGITMRGYDRAVRLAWTLADQRSAASPTTDDVDTALHMSGR